MLDDGLSKHTNIDPHSILGISIKAYPQSLFFTSLVYGIERTKNELQYRQSTQKNEDYSLKLNRYRNAALSIWQQQGVKGFFRGFHPKILSNSVGAVGANILFELGKKA